MKHLTLIGHQHLGLQIGHRVLQKMGAPGGECQRANPRVWDLQNLHSLKLTFSHLKMDGWNTFSFPIGFRPIFRDEVLLVSGRVEADGHEMEFLQISETRSRGSRG